MMMFCRQTSVHENNYHCHYTLHQCMTCLRVLTAEYIISLGNLTFETFSNAIREKYEDLYFEEDLVVNLFD